MIMESSNVNSDFVVSIGDYDDYEVEYVVSEEDGYVSIMKCEMKEERGLVKEYRVLGVRARELYRSMINDEVISDDEGVVVGVGEEVEEYIGLMTDWIICYKKRG